MAQLLKKFIGDNQVADEKIRLDNNSFLRARNAANSADVDMFKVSAGDNIQPGGQIDMNGNVIDNSGNIFFNADNTQQIGTTGGRASELYVRKINGDGAKLEISGSPIEVQNELLPATNSSQDIGSSTLNFATIFANEIQSDSGTLTFTSALTEVSGNFVPLSNASQNIGDVSFAFGNAYIQNVYDSTGDNFVNLVGAINLSSTTEIALNATDEIDLNANADVWIRNSDGAASSLRFYDNDVSNYVALKAAATVSSDVTWTLPSADGSSGQFLQTNGSGALSWASPSGGELTNKATFTLSAGDITNQYIDLSHVAKTNSIVFFVRGGGVQQEGASYDYSVNYTGGAGGNTRITFLNDLATAGASALVAGDIVVIQYEY